MLQYISNFLNKIKNSKNREFICSCVLGVILIVCLLLFLFSAIFFTSLSNEKETLEVSSTKAPASTLEPFLTPTPEPVVSNTFNCRLEPRLTLAELLKIKNNQYFYSAVEISSTEIPAFTTATTPLTEPTEEQTPDSPIETDKWLCYLATAYNSDEPDPKGNRGESLRGRKAIAMWQSDTDYTKYRSMVEPFKSFLTNKELAIKYGALPYGTKVEMRMWNPEISDYRYLGIYEVLDDSPTTIYNLSEMTHSLAGPTGPLYFYFDWLNINYMGNSVKGGRLKGYCPNWKEEYSNNVIGWLDIWEWSGSMIIVEIKIISE